jgi:hypothetical protein
MRLPREIEGDPCREAVREALAAKTRLLWPGGTLTTTVVPLTNALARALVAAATSRVLRRGLEAAESALDAERRGLAARPAEEAARRGARVSRLLLITNDGAERFYRQVERLIATHAPRVLACLLDCDAATLGKLLYDHEAVAKLILVEHKTAVAGVLRALAGGTAGASIPQRERQRRRSSSRAMRGNAGRRGASEP